MHTNINVGDFLQRGSMNPSSVHPPHPQRVHKTLIKQLKWTAPPRRPTRYQAQWPGSGRSGLPSPTCLSGVHHRDCREKDHVRNTHGEGGCGPEQAVNESSEGSTDENLLLMSIGTPSITALPFNDSAVIDVRHPGTSQYWELFMSLKRGPDIH